MSNRGREYILDSYWRLKVYSNDFKVFRGNKETLILSEQNEILLVIKELKDFRLNFSKLSEDLDLKIGKNIIYISFKGCGEREEGILGDISCSGEIDNHYELSDVKRGKRILSSGLAICEKCLRKALDLDEELGVIVYNHILIDKEIHEKNRICDFCGFETMCILKDKVLCEEKESEEKNNNSIESKKTEKGLDLDNKDANHILNNKINND